MRQRDSAFLPICLVPQKHAGGDQIITTGLGGVFPPDVLVGTVQELVPEASGKSVTAVIRPGGDARTVKHAFIITGE